MYCPRLDHFVRFNPNGTVSRCGHMVNPPLFTSLEEMEASSWLATIKEEFEKDQWPKECVRCQQTEQLTNTSIRINAIKFDHLQTDKTYLSVGGVLDNICNSACQFCSAELSTKIGGLQGKEYAMYDNTNQFWSLPQERIVHLDINGGEPSASKNYKQVLKQLPPNVKSIRVNTNCSLIIDELADIKSRGIHVTVTASFDGIGKIHDYVRWPISWDKFETNLRIYKDMGVDLNLWTTINTLNLDNLEDMLEYVEKHELNHSYGILEDPQELNIKYVNDITSKVKQRLLVSNNLAIKNLAEYVAISSNNNEKLWNYINKQDQLRNIQFTNYYD
jgi:sulfatase maturation enzyme AslB (radical SAM superfamily)